MAKNKRFNTKIEHVLQLAIEDFDFLQMLVKNMDSALSEYNMDLTKTDKKTLTKMLNHKAKVSGSDMLQITNYLLRGTFKKVRKKTLKSEIWGGY